MTEKEKVPPAAKDAAELVERSFEQIKMAVSDAWTRIRPVIEGVAKDAATISAGTAALGELFGASKDTDDGEYVKAAREALSELDDAQLKDLEHAAVALSLIASGMQKEEREQ